MLYRIKQFLWAINSRINDDDLNFVKEYLNGEEQELFSKLKGNEQNHSIRVARGIQKQCVDRKIKENKILIKAGLLHDIGKIDDRLTLVDKSILVMLDRISNGKIKKYDNIKKINTYYNHSQQGYKILKQIETNKKILYLVKNHHNANINNNMELAILKENDDKN